VARNSSILPVGILCINFLSVQIENVTYCFKSGLV